MENRGTFKSKFGVIAAVGGSVVGLGNIWRFPYVAGENGGAAFILIYIMVSLLISIPIMLSEFSIGRSTQANAKRSFLSIAPKSHWHVAGYIGILCAFLILSFYSVIAGWALEFVSQSLQNTFATNSPEEVSRFLSEFINSGWRPILWTGFFVLATATIVLSGVEKGIERYNKILMPLLVLILLLMAINSLTLEGASEGVRFLLTPDFSKVTGDVILEAIGQSFFSMSLGLGCMITYGSYIKRSENMFRIGGVVAISDVLFAILSGLAIFPAVFSFGISPSSGPALVFLTLPNVFAQMTGGYIISIAFFILLFLAAITSSVSLFEVLVAYFSEEFKITRRKTILMLIPCVLILGSLCALSQMEGSSLHIGSKNIFDFCDSITSNILMPLGGLLIVLFTGWRFATQAFKNEVTTQLKYGVGIFPILLFLIKFIIPVVLVLLFLNQTGVI